MADLRIVASARQDLADIFDYIARGRPIAAGNWVRKIEEKCELTRQRQSSVNYALSSEANYVAVL